MRTFRKKNEIIFNKILEFEVEELLLLSIVKNIESSICGGFLLVKKSDLF